MTWVFRTSVAIWAMSVAIGIMPRLVRPAGPDDLPGAMKHAGINASVPAMQFVLVIVATFVITLLFGRFGRLLAERRWAAWSCSIALASAPVTLMAFGNVRHVILHGAVAAAIVLLRRLEPRFTRADIVLLPALLVLYFAFLDLQFGRTAVATILRAALIVFALRIAIGALSRSARPGLAFAAAPLAFLMQVGYFEPRWAGAIAALWVIVTPFVLMRVREDLLERFAAHAAYPVGVAAYTLALVGWTPPIVDVFEDMHSLLPASEMARHERPYREIAPIHGLLSDGLLDLAAMHTVGDNLGAILKTRQCLGVLSVAAIYFVALAATTSADLALLSAFLSLSLFPFNAIFLRAVVPLLALACVVAATRLRAPRWFALAGILLVISTLVSLDLAVFSGCVAVLAAVRARAVRYFLAGFAAAAVPALVLLALSGVLLDFFHSSLIEVIGTNGVYVMAPLDVPQGLHTLGAIVAWIGDAHTFAGLMWFAALIGSAAVLTVSPLRARRSDGTWLIGVWIVLAGASYVVRHNYYFAFAVGPFIIAGILALRRHSRSAAIALAIAVALIARPFSHVFDVATPLRRSGGIVAADFSEFRGVRRGRGAVFSPATAKALASTQRFLATSLRPNETFYDFAGGGLLYYLFERDCPVRMMTAPATERVEAQREVIAALERNRNVRAVLILFPGGLSHIDDIPNAERAPLVWRYIEQHFQPAFAEDGVVFWMRR